jgi:uncharacterized ferritin-like protein (DUF455 family)
LTLFSDPPARDSRFIVREFWRDMTNLSHDHPDVGKEFLHRQMNEEIDSLEMAARNLTDFPDAPWELRMSIARQCSDEARHVQAFRRLFEKRGGVVGEYPILNFQYRIIMAIDTLIGRLAVANRSFEAAGIDAIQQGLNEKQREADEEFIFLFDAQLADEIEHVRFANRWIKTLVEQQGGRAVLAIARAVAHADAAFAEIVGESGITHAVDEATRREAGFSDDEIESARALAGRA